MARRTSIITALDRCVRQPAHLRPFVSGGYFMARHRTLLTWSFALASAMAFVFGAAAQQVLPVGAKPRLITPDNPIWADVALQDPTTPPTQDPTQAPAAGGRGGRGGANALPAPRPYNQVVTAQAKTDKGIFTVHRVNETLLYEIPKEQLDKDFL